MTTIPCRVASGKTIDLANLKPSDIDISDVAHHLSHINRFNGATVEPYSVLCHSLLVSELAYAAALEAAKPLCTGVPLIDKSPRPVTAADAPLVALYGLLHDAHEAYTGDITLPMKRLLMETSIADPLLVGELNATAYGPVADIENEVQTVIEDALVPGDPTSNGWGTADDERLTYTRNTVHICDRIACELELQWLFPCRTGAAAELRPTFTPLAQRARACTPYGQRLIFTRQYWNLFDRAAVPTGDHT